MSTTVRIPFVSEDYQIATQFRGPDGVLYDVPSLKSLQEADAISAARKRAIPSHTTYQNSSHREQHTSFTPAVTPILERSTRLPTQENRPEPGSPSWSFPSFLSFFRKGAPNDKKTKQEKKTPTHPLTSVPTPTALRPQHSLQNKEMANSSPILPLLPPRTEIRPTPSRSILLDESRGSEMLPQLPTEPVSKQTTTTTAPLSSTPTLPQQSPLINGLRPIKERETANPAPLLPQQTPSAETRSTPLRSVSIAPDKGPVTTEKKYPALVPTVPTPPTLPPQTPIVETRSTPLRSVSTAPDNEPATTEKKSPALVPTVPTPTTLPPQTPSVETRSTPPRSIPTTSDREPAITEEKSPALVLDNGLTAEEIARITAYKLPVYVPELTAAQIKDLNPQQQMKRQMDQRNEPKTLREAIEDIRNSLREITELNKSIALFRDKAKEPTRVSLDEIRKNKDNVATLAARRLGILSKVYLGRSEEELKAITEKECLALADRFLALAPERLEQLAAGLAVVVQAPAEETLENKLKKAKKQLANTDSNVRSMQAAIKRGTVEIARLQEEIKKANEKLSIAAASGDDNAVDRVLEQHDSLVAALEDAEKSLNGDPKTGKPSLAKKLAALNATADKQRVEVAKLQEQLPPGPAEALIAPPSLTVLPPIASQSPGEAPKVMNAATSSGIPIPPPPPPPPGPAAAPRPNPMGGTNALMAAINAKRKDE